MQGLGGVKLDSCVHFSFQREKKYSAFFLFLSLSMSYHEF